MILPKSCRHAHNLLLNTSPGANRRVAMLRHNIPQAFTIKTLLACYPDP